ncbi:Flp pilus assembly protein CpaB [Paraburkholderia bryophila]|uniref:Flp pilus assembly protein CpaB n=1 Tax=Paraburkholderia bryophila TaxID=420952 RepID=UPI0023499C1C|nr:Flp pilus assembly protein CpaB [Paraburkholderia bryophila]WCM23280.1 Flp pilus assembly protein CpaB [Paraburkholderia bryophila]
MFRKIKFRSLFANSWVLLFLAVLVAGGLTYLLYRYLNDRESKLKADIAAHGVRAGVEVVVPAQDVPVGTPLSSDAFVSREIPGDMVYDDMIRTDDFQQYRASHLVKPVRRGLPLRAGDVDSLRGRDFADALPVGQRAVTVEIDTVNSTALLIRPGNRVDVYWLGKTFHESQSADDKKMAQLLLPNVLVLATGQDMRPRDAGEAARQDQANANSSAMSRQEGMGYTTVTLQVPVEDVARIALAQKIGGLRLILRNAEDKGSAGPSLVQESEVFMDPGQRTRGTGIGTGRAAQSVEVIAGGGANSSSTLVPLMPPGAPSNAEQEGPRADTPAANAAQSAPAAALQRQPSLYEQANAIAQQLQKAVTPSASKQN